MWISQLRDRHASASAVIACRQPAAATVAGSSRAAAIATVTTITMRAKRRTRWEEQAAHRDAGEVGVVELECMDMLVSFLV
ncbi:hypothetical protein ASE41_20570 [Streptomyces sp. Root264]|nr:hypothetical protein ASE41_20570 [Streptomyces sp. Root264]